jgi:hypothetical protein
LATAAIRYVKLFPNWPLYTYSRSSLVSDVTGGLTAAVSIDHTYSSLAYCEGANLEQQGMMGASRDRPEMLAIDINKVDRGSVR